MVMTVFEFVLARAPRTRYALQLAAVLLLAACVAPPTTQDSEYTDHYGNEVFGAGFTMIADRYIDPISLRELSVSGMSGLSSLDSQLAFSDVGNGARLTYAGHPFGTINLPSSQKPEAWSDVTVRAIAMARTASPTVAKADAEAIFKAVFDGIVEPLDGFTRYAGNQRATEHRALRDGFGGIGVSIRMEDDSALVLSVNDVGPAADAKVLANDRVTHVQGEPVAGWTQRQLVDRLRGKIGTKLQFTVQRPEQSEPLLFTLTRAHIVPVTVTSRREDNVAIIRVVGFNRETARKVESAIKDQLKESERPLAGLVLDLRSNPGGLLDQAVELADTFLDSGDIILTFGRHPRSLQRFVATVGDLTGGLPLVILVNGNSASASEVVTAALQDQARAIVVGSNSFGKGTVQTVLQLPNNGEITLTWSRLVTPSGYRLHKLGILPSVCTRSDGEQTVTADRLLSQVEKETQTLKDQFSRWRATGNRDSSDRETLRALCPSDSGSPDTDVAIAKNLLANPKLYNELIRKGTINLAGR